MVKKSLLTMVIAGLLGVFVFGSDVWSVIKTAGSSMRDSVKSEVPLEFELKRARELRNELNPEMKKLMTQIAEQKVEIRHMQKKVDDRQVVLADMETILRSRNTDLKRNRVSYEYAGAEYTSEDLRRDLEIRLEKFQTEMSNQTRDKKILADWKGALHSNEQLLEEMKTSLDTLDLQISELENRLKAVEVAETVQNLKYNDNKLSQARTLLDEIEKGIEVREQMVQDHGNGSANDGLIPAENTVQKNDVTAQIDDLLGSQEETMPASLPAESNESR